MGATISVDYTKENVLTQSKTYDVIIDLSGKMGYANAKQLMKSKALFVNPTPQPIEILTYHFKNLFTGQKHIVILAKPDAKNMTTLLNAVNNGFQIELSKIFPFVQAVEAYQYAQKGGMIGKVAIEVNLSTAQEQ